MDAIIVIVGIIVISWTLIFLMHFKIITSGMAEFLIIIIVFLGLFFGSVKKQGVANATKDLIELFVCSIILLALFFMGISMLRPLGWHIGGNTPLKEEACGAAGLFLFYAIILAF